MAIDRVWLTIACVIVAQTCLPNQTLATEHAAPSQRNDLPEASSARVPLPLTVSCGLPDGQAVATGTFAAKNAIRFTLRPDQPGLCPADIKRGGYSRVELRGPDLPRDRSISIRFSILIPEDFNVLGPVFVGQIHQRHSSALILLAVTPDEYRVATGSGLRALGAVVERQEPLFTRQEFGTWQQVHLRGLFSGEHAFIEVYANDRLKYRATGVNARTAPYFKIGIYGRSSRMAGPLSVTVADVTMASGETTRHSPLPATTRETPSDKQH